MKQLMLVAAIHLALIPTHVLASDCTAIKLDKARLKCYDAADKSSGEKAIENSAAKAEVVQAQGREFKSLSAIFVRDAQANLAISALAWQNLLANPSSASEVSSEDSTRKAAVAASFSKLAEHPGYAGPISEKLKDYFAAWQLSYSLIRPTSADYGRAYANRVNIEMSKADAAAARLKLDLQ